jgi:hypothetical protein
MSRRHVPDLADLMRRRAVRGVVPIDSRQLETILKEDSMKASTITGPKPEPLDVALLRSFPGGKDRLHGVDPAAAGHIGGAAIALLAEHPNATRRDTPALAHRLWERVRAEVYDDAGRTVEQAMAVARLPGFLYELELVIDLLLSQGNVKATLLAQREAIDRQLVALGRIGTR